MLFSFGSSMVSPQVLYASFTDMKCAQPATLFAGQVPGRCRRSTEERVDQRRRRAGTVHCNLKESGRESQCCVMQGFACHVLACGRELRCCVVPCVCVALVHVDGTRTGLLLKSDALLAHHTASLRCDTCSLTAENSADIAKRVTSDTFRKYNTLSSFLFLAGHHAARLGRGTGYASLRHARTCVCVWGGGGGALSFSLSLSLFLSLSLSLSLLCVCASATTRTRDAPMAQYHECRKGRRKSFEHARAHVYISAPPPPLPSLSLSFSRARFLSLSLSLSPCVWWCCVCGVVSIHTCVWVRVGACGSGGRHYLHEPLHQRGQRVASQASGRRRGSGYGQKGPQTGCLVLDRAGQTGRV